MGEFKVLLVGFGSIGQGLVPLLLQELKLTASQVSAICAKPKCAYTEKQNRKAKQIASEQGVRLDEISITAKNLNEVLNGRLGAGDILVNVSVNVSSIALIQWCQEHEVIYLDTCIEPWEGEYAASSELGAMTNYALRTEALSLKGKGKSTAIVSHGANPGLVTHFAKEGLLKLAQIYNLGLSDNIPEMHKYALISKALGVQAIHIAERDTQSLGSPLNANEFANTWSTDGLISEGLFQPAEIGNGTHEAWDTYSEIKATKHKAGDQSSVWLNKISSEVLIKSWTPSQGEQKAMAITHHENSSIANMLSLFDEKGLCTYRPSVTYAYNPSSEAWESLKAHKERLSNGCSEFERTVFVGNQSEEFDELGVLFLMKDACYWFGSTLTVAQAKAVSSYNGPTTLQVTASIIGALQWALNNPVEGVVEAESMDHKFVMNKVSPYLGEIKGVLSSWNPIPGEGLEFKNFLI